jgi:type VI secretion system protein ImpF
MPRTDNEVRITLSVFDRLLDYEPEMSREALPTRTRNLRHLKDSVKRDLEWLLNTRQTPDDVPDELVEVNKSLAAYGLPDFTSMSTKNPADEKRLRRSLEVAIRNFEPRLENVRVTLEPVDETDRTVRFRIDAQLKVDPAPEPITFDSVWQSGGKFTLRGD